VVGVWYHSRRYPVVCPESCWWGRSVAVGQTGCPELDRFRPAEGVAN
jgi:hypothetical protein